MGAPASLGPTRMKRKIAMDDAALHPTPGRDAKPSDAFDESFDRREVRSRGESFDAPRPAGPLGTAREALARAADKARAAVGRAGCQVKAAYGRASGKTREVVGEVDPLVRRKPYAALGVAAAAGLLIGLLAKRGRAGTTTRKPRR